jgi:hypothetical protein
MGSCRPTGNGRRGQRRTHPIPTRRWTPLRPPSELASSPPPGAAAAPLFPSPPRRPPPEGLCPVAPRRGPAPAALPTFPGAPPGSGATLPPRGDRRWPPRPDPRDRRRPRLRCAGLPPPSDRSRSRVLPRCGRPRVSGRCELRAPSGSSRPATARPRGFQPRRTGPRRRFPHPDRPARPRHPSGVAGPPPGPEPLPSPWVARGSRPTLWAQFRLGRIQNRPGLRDPRLHAGPGRSRSGAPKACGPRGARWMCRTRSQRA